MECHANIWLVQYLSPSWSIIISIFVAFISAILHIAYCLLNDRQLALNATMGKALAGYVLPPAMLMGLASLDPVNLLGCVTNLEIYIFAGAFSVIWITLSILFPGRFTWRWIQNLGEKFHNRNSAT
jgi:hypothetical protein